MRRARNDDQVGKPADLALADRLQPLFDDLFIGAAGAEAKHARCGAGLDLGGERGQLVEQFVIGGEIAGVAHLLGDFDQATLGCGDRRRQPLRFRQAEQGERAIGLEFDDALHQRTGALRRHLAIGHQYPDEAGRPGLKVGGVDRRTVGILGDRKARIVEQALRRGARQVFGQQMQIDRDQQRSGLRDQSHR